MWGMVQRARWLARDLMRSRLDEAMRALSIQHSAFSPEAVRIPRSGLEIGIAGGPPGGVIPTSCGSRWGYPRGNPHILWEIPELILENFRGYPQANPREFLGISPAHTFIR